ncbi:MAG TPA: hypothetical protein VJM49_02530, partial [Acidimicrobiales bacterium]|nr:hypothetical protein [Acidimicrobiales bacterium]
RIGAELHRRVTAALAPGDAPDADRAAPDAVLDDLAEVVDLMLAGALLRAGTGHLPYDAIGDRLAALVHLVLGDRP